MMKAQWMACAAVIAAASCFSNFQTAQAGTIIKLSLGNDVAPDLEYSAGVLSTVDDTIPGTSGDQNTAVEFLDFLSFIPNIPAAAASYSLNGVTQSALPQVLFGTVVVQEMSGGNFQLWDDNNALLLSATLGDSILQGTTGAAGPAASGAVFSTTLGDILGGTLQQYIAPNTISISIAMTSVASGATAGMIVNQTPGGPELANFTADASKTIAAEQVPEPATAALFVLSLLVAPLASRRRR